MTYLHEFLRAREEIRKLTPKLLASIIPILDQTGCEYQALWEGQPSYTHEADSILVSMPEGMLPDGYQLRIDFVPVKPSTWKAPDGTDKRGPGF